MARRNEEGGQYTIALNKEAVEMHQAYLDEVADEFKAFDPAEAFRLLLLAMIPKAAHCGGNRRFQSGWFRLCVLSWRVGRDEYWPGMTGDQVAGELGISYQAFKKHLAIVDSFLARGQAGKL